MNNVRKAEQKLLFYCPCGNQLEAWSHESKVCEICGRVSRAWIASEVLKDVSTLDTLYCPYCRSRDISKGNFYRIPTIPGTKYFKYYCDECYEMFDIPIRIKKEIQWEENS